jgi:hypothetical protein
MYMKHLFVVSIFVFLLPSFVLANDYYWRIGQCQPGVQSEACNGKIISLSLTDATHYGELKLINLPSSIGEAMTLSSCDRDVDSLVKSLKNYDIQYPYTSYNTDIVMIRKTNEERFNIVLKSEALIKACIVNHPKLLEAEAKKRAEEEARLQREAEMEQALKNCDLAFFEQMTNSEKMAYNKIITSCRESTSQQKALELQRISEEAEKKQRDADESAAKALAEQASQQALIAPKPAPVAPPKPISAPVAVPEPDESKEVTETAVEESISEEKAIEEEIIEPEMVIEPTTEPKPTFFQRMKNFFKSWF